MNYGQALELLKQGKKVSCNRWGNEGKVYVSLLDTLYGSFQVKNLVLVDVKREKTVSFTPSVENQLEDEWYEVK